MLFQATRIYFLATFPVVFMAVYRAIQPSDITDRTAELYTSVRSGGEALAVASTGDHRIISSNIYLMLDREKTILLVTASTYFPELVIYIYM